MVQEQELWPNHRGVYVIKAPSDMPLVLIAMLQATIGEAWVEYGGDPNNAEQFWNHLAANGMTDVPRETLPSVPLPGADEGVETVPLIALEEN